MKKWLYGWSFMSKHSDCKWLFVNGCKSKKKKKKKKMVVNGCKSKKWLFRLLNLNTVKSKFSFSINELVVDTVEYRWYV